MKRLEINLPGREYPIIIGRDIISAIPAEFEQMLNGRKLAVVTDENVWSIHGQRFEAGLREHEITDMLTVVVPPGEKSKSLDQLKQLYSEFFNFGLNRSGVVMAFGGGVVGDLAGFAAATYMRGVDFIQVPTTLLAQVDSSVGGKVAVNLDEGKNLVGSFYQPSLVLADTGVLATLPEREWKAGMAEVIKYAFIGEDRLFPLIEGSIKAKGSIEDIVYLCCESKAGYVERDERDSSVRMMLNFGHTFGHAVEKRHKFTKYNHGEAVAIGMAMALRTGSLLGLTVPGTKERLAGILEAHGLSSETSDDISILAPLMLGDKKNSGGDITLILLKKTGEPFTYKISAGDLIKLFEVTKNG